MKIPAFSKTYEDTKVLDFPGLDLESGKIYAVIGANGSGKSTFGKILSGVLKPDKREHMPRTVTVGYMPQKSYGFRMSTKANILLNGKDEARANALMDAIQIRHLENKRADKLSGGETARMALVRLMMKHYDMVLLDEPTAAMDMETTLLSEKLIAEYVKESNCSLILVTHSLQQARRIADEVWYFHKGKLLETGSKEQVLNSPQRAETKQFLEFYGV
jgi:ABC-type multidrug transport system ATPase subunit